MSITGNTVLLLVSVTVGFTAVIVVLSAIIGREVGETGEILPGAALTAAFPNAGNFGIPVATFAFGTVRRTTPVVFFLVQNVLLYPGGIYDDSRRR